MGWPGSVGTVVGIPGGLPELLLVPLEPADWEPLFWILMSLPHAHSAEARAKAEAQEKSLRLLIHTRLPQNGRVENASRKGFVLDFGLASWQCSPPKAMGSEIERKFLVNPGVDWRGGAKGVRYIQGYLCTEANRTVRVRIAGSEGYITVKGIHQGIHRREYEYKIPPGDAEEMLRDQCIQPLIEKARYRIEYGDHTWEVDVFEGENDGLVVAEIELLSADQAFERPPWLGDEVSHDMRYTNAYLNEHPYRRWPREG